MIVDSLLLMVGLALLVGGGELLVRGAVGVARSLGVSTLMIGLTIVAFGTSAPELAVNINAAVRGSGEISFGNIIGSNIANLGLILGLSALVRRLVIARGIIAREIPMMLLATAALLVMAHDMDLSEGPAVGVTDVVGRGDGLLLLMLFVVFLYYTIGQALRERDGVLEAQMEAEGMAEAPPSVRVAWLLLLGGLVGVVAGGDLTVRGAIGLAAGLGVSEAVIGLSVIAVGTSLPELVTCIAAVRRGHADIAIGNVVGSNIFNLLLIMGVTATVRPVDVPLGGALDLWVMAGLSILIWPMAMRHRNLVRWEGAVLLAVYVAYLSWRVATGSVGGEVL